MSHTGYRQAGWALFGAGLFLLVLIAMNMQTPLRGALALAFFLGGPGTALVPHLHVQDGALSVSLAIGVSVVVTLLVAQAMLWCRVSSPAAAVGGLLAVTAAGLVVRERDR